MSRPNWCCTKSIFKSFELSLRKRNKTRKTKSCSLIRLITQTTTTTRGQSYLPAFRICQISSFPAVIFFSAFLLNGIREENCYFQAPASEGNSFGSGMTNTWFYEMTLILLHKNVWAVQKQQPNYMMGLQNTQQITHTMAVSPSQ